LVFVSQDETPALRRVASGFAAISLMSASYMLLNASFLSGWERAGVALISFLISLPLAMSAFRINAKYEFGATGLSGWLGYRRFWVPYRDIEYVGYTAESRFWGGVRYDPWVGGILHISTKPGFLIAVDLNRQHFARVSRVLRVPVRRLLLSVDEPAQFVSCLRQQTQQARIERRI